MKKENLLLTVSFFVICLLCSFAPGDWINLGSRQVDFKIDHDVIPVTFREGYCTAIKIEVERGALNMHKCIIHFENGGKQEVQLRHYFSPTSNSRVVDLKGNKRHIDRIEFWYDTKSTGKKKAFVTVWGKK